MTQDGLLANIGDKRRLRCLLPAEGYALWADTYDADPNPLLALEERTLDSLLPNLEGSTVLDAACGTGRWLSKLLSLGAREGIGVDFSYEMLVQGMRKRGLRGRLVQAECAAIPVATGTIDLAICSMAAGYLADLHGLASELSRVMRKGGRLILTDFHPESSRKGWRRTFRYAGEVIEIQNFQHSADQLCASFHACGFKIERILSPCFGDPEKTIFEQCGKEPLFEQARQGPAILICCFTRGGRCSPGDRR
jgi:malonyl-CoA O-methyltransferase